MRQLPFGTLPLAFATIILALLWAFGVLTAPHEVEEPTPPARTWSFAGPLGTIDVAAAQRGLQVYKEVCSTCHSLRLLSFDDLAGLGYQPGEIEAFAATFTVPTVNADGTAGTRPGIRSDQFPPPFANEQAARTANSGALPPDLTLITEARLGGADYVYAFLTGFHEPPADMTLLPGMNYNAYFPSHQTAMPNMLSEGGVTYADGTAATVERQAADVVTFLTWAAEPQLEERNRTGIKVLIFLIAFTGVMFAVKRRVWANQH